MLARDGLAHEQDDVPRSPGPIVLFGSGEASPIARRVHAAVLSQVTPPIRACVLETPAGFEHTFGTYRLCLQYAADHWYMHRGQLADARRAAGLERMWV